MRRLSTFFIVIVMLFVVGNSFAQYNWESFNIGTFENLNSVSFPNINTGYIVGNIGKVYKTTNAGYNWTLNAFPSNGNNFYVYFLNSTTGFVSNQGGLYKTVDGGGNWALVTLPTSYNITSIHFSSASTGWAGDYYGDILKTTNGGDSWVNTVVMPGYDAKVFFINDFTGWSVDTYGFVNKTTNGGTNYTQTRLVFDTLSSVNFISSTIGFIVGDSGKVFKTTNGGNVWNLISSDLYGKLNSIYMESPLKITVCGHDGLVLFSEDGGNTWAFQISTASDLQQVTYASASSSGWAVGDLGTYVKKVATSANACVGSSNVKSAYPFYSYYMDSRTDMLYLANEIYLAGGGVAGNITKIGFTFDSLFSSQILNGFNIKLKTTNAASLTGFDNSGWSTVYSGTYTVTGLGQTYIDLQTPFAYTQGNNLLVEVCFNNSSYTTNTFVNSSPAPGMTYHGHQDLGGGNGCVDITTGNVMVNRPNICFFTSVISGNPNQHSNVPKDFKLYQNFPNPFNPMTKIKFDVPKSSFVTLKIYDILGKEVASLVNEKLQPNSYAIDFNASGLNSGVYFCQLSVDNAPLAIKKMLLVK
jgi:Secretion system C-terminal sorting domain/Photosynthesis system II assembly factor YCF48